MTINVLTLPSQNTDSKHRKLLAGFKEGYLKIKKTFDLIHPSSFKTKKTINSLH